MDAASQEMSCLLCVLKIHWRVHKISPLPPIPSHINPVHDTVSVRSILSAPTSSRLSFPFRICDQNLISISYPLHACYSLICICVCVCVCSASHENFLEQIIIHY